MACFLRLLFLLLASITTITEAVSTCHSCTSVADVTSCNATVTCGQNEKCYTLTNGTFGNRKFTMGCRPEQTCSGYTSSNGLPVIGKKRSTATRDDNCFKCCSTDGCNQQLCANIDSVSATAPSVGVCKDDATTNCALLDSVINICTDIDHAKLICKNTCGLCDLVDGNFTDWSSWSSCSVTCGDGHVTRTRTCTNPAPKHGGHDCVGNTTDVTACQSSPPCPATASSVGVCKDDSTINCALLDNLINICTDIDHAKQVCKNTCGLCGLVDGNFTDWSTWSSCSVPCGDGHVTRTRTCTNPAPQHGGHDCIGNTTDVIACQSSPPCPVNGGWSSWLAWESCSATCGTGMRRRNRTCTSPAPSGYGRYCRGDAHFFELCTESDCSQNGGWSAWSSWSSCNGRCPFGLRTSTRTCTNPAPKGQGLACIGDAHDKIICPKICPLSTNNLRLVNGSGTNGGRVEVYYNGVWGTVCDGNWDNTDATVVCRQLGFSTGIAFYGNQHQFGPGTGMIWTNNVNCTGSESWVGDCHNIGWGFLATLLCTHYDDAGVQCT